MLPDKEGLEAMFTFETGEGSAVDQEVFRVLMLGDWSGRSVSTDLSQRQPVFIDRDEFDDVMKRISPEVDIDLSRDGSGEISLKFSSLDDFHPDSLFSSLPIFGELRDLRNRLSSPDTFNSAATEVRGWAAGDVATESLQTDSASGADNSQGLLDEILSGSSSRASKSGDGSLQHLVRELVAPYLVRVDEDEQAELISAVDDAVSNLMRKIIHSENFQRLESSWRGLHRLIRKVPTGVDLKIFLLEMTKEEFCADLKGTEDLSDSRLFKLFKGEGTGASWALVCGNYSFDVNVDDIATLIRVSKIAAEFSCPFVAHVYSEKLCALDFEDMRVEDVGFGDDARTEKLWNVLRSEDGATSIGMMTPRYLGRLPYGKDCDVVESFSFEEFVEAPSHENYLWVNPSFLFATLVAKAYAECGWELYGGLQQDVTDLPMHVYKIDGHTFVKPCAEFVMSESSCESFIDLGIMPVVSFKDTDRIKIANLKSVAEGGKRLKANWR